VSQFDARTPKSSRLPAFLLHPLSRSEAARLLLTRKRMFRALNIAATGMAAQETNLEAISHNIANGNTVGFKKERIDFQDLLYQTVRQAGTPTGPTTTSPTGLQIGTGVRVVST